MIFLRGTKDAVVVPNVAVRPNVRPTHIPTVGNALKSVGWSPVVPLMWYTLLNVPVAWGTVCRKDQQTPILSFLHERKDVCLTWPGLPVYIMITLCVVWRSVGPLPGFCVCVEPLLISVSCSADWRVESEVESEVIRRRGDTWPLSPTHWPSFINSVNRV